MHLQGLTYISAQYISLADITAYMRGHKGWYWKISLRSLGMVILPRWELTNEQWHSKPLPITLAGCLHPISLNFQQCGGAFQDSGLHQRKLPPSKAAFRVLCLHLYAKETDSELNQPVIRDELPISLLLLNYPIRMEIMNLDRRFKIIVGVCVSTTVKIRLPQLQLI